MIRHDLRERIVEAARACVGTPFRHQGRTPGVALDCGGLVLWPQRALGMDFSETLDYGPAPNPERMLRILLKHFVEIDRRDLLPGDIVWLRMVDVPQHLALYTGKTLIHATCDGPRRVVEHGFRAVWPGRVHKAFRYRWLHEMEMEKETEAG